VAGAQPLRDDQVETGTERLVLAVAEEPRSGAISDADPPRGIGINHRVRPSRTSRTAKSSGRGSLMAASSRFVYNANSAAADGSGRRQESAVTQRGPGRNVT
jgi:hypothetical protein